MKSEKRLYRGDSKENRLLIRQPILLALNYFFGGASKSMIQL